MDRMVKTLSTITFAVLLGTTISATAGELDSRSIYATSANGLGIASQASSSGLAMTGGRAGTRSVRAIARDKGLALLALIGHHLDNRLKAGKASALYANSPTDTLDSRSTVSAASRLRNHLLGVDASFALGKGRVGHKKAPLRASISANPKRIRLTVKYRW